MGGGGGDGWWGGVVFYFVWETCVGLPQSRRKGKEHSSFSHTFPLYMHPLPRMASGRFCFLHLYCNLLYYSLSLISFSSLSVHISFCLACLPCCLPVPRCTRLALLQTYLPVCAFCLQTLACRQHFLEKDTLALPCWRQNSNSICAHGIA